MSDAASYDQVFAANMTAARARRRLSQRDVAERMVALGFPWRQQIVAAAELRGRRVAVGEVLGLALALETSIGKLMEPTSDDRQIALPSADVLLGGTVQASVRFQHDGRIRWDANTPTFGEPTWPRDGDDE